MRLINCRDMRLVEYFGDDIPPYAILSHTWGQGEVAYKDWGTIAASTMPGWYKIQQTCWTALFHGLEYAWVDTCCIDKSSSAELSEAINSMFQWYARSKVCYAYIEDYDGALTWQNNTFPLASTRWMSRGWTLQELIAPQTVIFFDFRWQRLSTRRELSEGINLATRISMDILARKDENIDDLLQLIPVCEKMSWASRRQTSRVEDTAYCLMGLFGVNMPLLYGEGPKAFIRLQEEIIRHTNDLTIFAWQAPLTRRLTGRNMSEEEIEERRKAETEAVRGILAHSPREFVGHKGSIEPEVTASSSEYTITNKGIRISSISIRPERNSSNFFMDLNSYHKGPIIRHIGGGVFVRVRPTELHNKFFSPNGEPIVTSLYLTPSVTAATMAAIKTLHHDAIRVPKIVGDSFHLQHIFPRLQIQGDSGLFITRGFPNTVGYATYRYKSVLREGQKRCDFVVFFGLRNLNTTLEAWHCIVSPDELPSFSHEPLAWEENLKRHSLDAQLRKETECKLKVEELQGVSKTFYIKGEFKIVDPIWNLSFEVKTI